MLPQGNSIQTDADLYKAATKKRLPSLSDLYKKSLNQNVFKGMNDSSRYSKNLIHKNAINSLKYVGENIVPQQQQQPPVKYVSRRSLKIDPLGRKNAEKMARMFLRAKIARNKEIAKFQMRNKLLHNKIVYYAKRDGKPIPGLMPVNPQVGVM